MVGVAGVMRSEFRVVMLPRFRRRDEILRIGNVVRAAHADESAGANVRLPVFPSEGLEQHRDVVGVARHDLQKALIGAADLVVDAASVRPSEAEFRALRQETARTFRALVILRFVFISGRRAVDDHRRAIDRFIGGVRDAMTELREIRARVFVCREPRAVIDQLIHFRAVVRRRRPLVKSDFVDAPPVLELIEQTDQRLADRSGADDMHDVLLRRHLALKSGGGL